MKMSPFVQYESVTPCVRSPVGRRPEDEVSSSRMRTRYRRTRQFAMLRMKHMPGTIEPEVDDNLRFGEGEPRTSGQNLDEVTVY